MSNHAYPADDTIVLSAPTARFAPQGSGRLRRGFGGSDGIGVEAVIQARVKVVCGEAWTGKTTAAQAIARWQGCPFVELRKCVGGPIPLPREGLVVLDGLDEALQHEPTIGTRIIRELRDARNVNTIITCRTIELPPTFVSDLASALDVPTGSVRLDLLPWSEADARDVVEMMYPSTFDTVVAFARKNNLESLLQFPRAVLALAHMQTRSELGSIIDEPSAWEAVLQHLLEETNAAVRQSQVTAKARLNAISRVAALMSMTGASEVKVHEAAARGGAHLAHYVDGEDLRAAHEALGIVGVEHRPGVWSIEPANIRDWLVAFGLRKLNDRNLIAALMPLKGHTLGIFNAVLRMRPQLAEKVGLLDKIEASLWTTAERGVVVGDQWLEETPSSLGRELATRIADETRQEFIRASLLRLVADNHARDVLPVALSLFRETRVTGLRHEALRVILRHGNDAEVAGISSDIPQNLPESDAAWIRYESLERGIIAPASLVWALSEPNEGVFDHRHLLLQAVARSLNRSDVLPFLRDVVSRRKWPTSDEIRRRIFALLLEDSPLDEEEADSLIDAYLLVGLDLKHEFDPVVYRGCGSAATRRVLFRRWLDSVGFPDDWAFLAPEDVDWFLGDRVTGPNTQAAFEWALAQCSDMQRGEVERRAEAANPGAVVRFQQRRDERRALEESWRQRRVAAQEAQSAMNIKTAVADAVNEILSRDGEAASKVHDLTWTVLTKGALRRQDVTGSFDDLTDELRVRLLDTIIDGITRMTAVPIPSADQTRVPTRYILEQELLVWLVENRELERERWLVERVVKEFLPGLLQRRFGNVSAVVTAMFVCHPDLALETALLAVVSDFAAPAGQVAAATNVPPVFWERTAAQETAERLLLTEPIDDRHRALLRILRDSASAVAGRVAQSWLDRPVYGDNLTAALDALIVTDTAAGVARLRNMDRSSREGFIKSSTCLDDFAFRGPNLTSLSSHDLAELFDWVEAVVPGRHEMHSGFLEPDDRLRLWKWTALNVLWRRFLSDDADAERRIDDLSARHEWLRTPFVRDQTSRSIRVAANTATQPRKQTGKTEHSTKVRR